MFPLNPLVHLFPIRVVSLLLTSFGTSVVPRPHKPLTSPCSLVLSCSVPFDRRLTGTPETTYSASPYPSSSPRTLSPYFLFPQWWVEGYTEGYTDSVRRVTSKVFPAPLVLETNSAEFPQTQKQPDRKPPPPSTIRRGTLSWEERRKRRSVLLEVIERGRLRGRGCVCARNLIQVKVSRYYRSPVSNKQEKVGGVGVRHRLYSYLGTPSGSFLSCFLEVFPKRILLVLNLSFNLLT